MGQEAETLRLLVYPSRPEDIRRLLCRMHEADLEALGITHAAYLDAVLVGITAGNKGKSVVLVARTPVERPGAPGRLERGQIRLDEWTRHRLGLHRYSEADESIYVTVARAGNVFRRLWFKLRYLWDSITRHPEISTRWQNMALAITVLGVIVTVPAAYGLWSLLGLLPVVGFLFLKILPRA